MPTWCCWRRRSARWAGSCRRIAPHLGRAHVVTDGGSTKQDVVALAYAHAGATRRRSSCPAHPIAGAEQSGVAAAHADLYRARKVVLTPLPENSARSIARVRAAWRACGARLFRMHAARARPRVRRGEPSAASAVLSRWWTRSRGIRTREQLFDFAAGGFRDFTRIAASHPEMWRDICLANRKALLQELDGYRARTGRGHACCCDAATRQGWRRCSPARAPRATNGCEAAMSCASGRIVGASHDAAISRSRAAYAARPARCKLPGSKSISNRILLLAALADGDDRIHDLLDSDDTRVMLTPCARWA